MTEGTLARSEGKVDTPLVSICMPLYNTERYVAAAVEGVLGQTYRNIELVICDNGSTDRSLAIVEEFARKDPRVRVVRNRRNLGYAGNLHKVTQLATGEFMMVHCADDLSAPTAIETCVKLATQSGVDRANIMVLTDSYVADATGTPTGVHVQRTGGYEVMFKPLETYQPTGVVRRFRGREALSATLPKLTICGWLGATFYSRTLFESIEGLYNGLLYSPDLQFNYHLLSRDPEVLWVQHPLFSWRLHESGQIGQARAKAFPKHAWDGYQYTFHFSTDLLTSLDVPQQAIIATFIDKLCLRKALSELRHGSTSQAFKHLCIALATYPVVAIRNPKFWIGAIGVLAGPIGRACARLGYATGPWRRT